MSNEHKRSMRELMAEAAEKRRRTSLGKDKEPGQIAVEEDETETAIATATATTQVDILDSVKSETKSKSKITYEVVDLTSSSETEQSSSPESDADDLDVIDLTNSQDDEPTTKTISTPTVNATNTPPYKSQIRMIANPEYCKLYDPTGDKDAISIADLVGSAKLIKTYQFNFMIDAGIILSEINADPARFQAVFINSGIDDHTIINPVYQRVFNIQHIGVADRLPKFGTHHTKMMVNFFSDDTCQLVIHTMNLTAADYQYQTQMCWISPKLSKHEHVEDYQDYKRLEMDLIEDNGKIFKRDYIDYLKSYKEYKLEQLINDIESYNFNPIDVQFIGSSPGKYSFKVDDFDSFSSTKENSKLFGYGKLYQLMKQYQLTTTAKAKFIAQVSTIAAPFDSKKSNIFTHILTSVIEGSRTLVKQPDHNFNKDNGVEPVIIWPTEPEVLKAFKSYLSGHALRFNNKAKQRYYAYANQYAMIKKFFHKWAPLKQSSLTSSSLTQTSRAKRGRLSPHVKTYCVTKDDFKTLDWFLLTSANLSKQAWGAPDRGYGAAFVSDSSDKFHKYSISSFEAGVMINPKTLRVKECDRGKKIVLVPAYGQDTLDSTDEDEGVVRYPVRLPYDTPLVKYAPEDEPWSVDALERAHNEADDDLTTY